MSSPEETNPGPVIRDLRRIDPRTGQVRNPAADVPGTAASGPGKTARPGKHSAAKPGGAGPEAGAAPGPAGSPETAGPAQAGPGERPANGGASGPATPGPGGAVESELAAK